jgi:hypothetical protein
VHCALFAQWVVWSTAQLGIAERIRRVNESDWLFGLRYVVRPVGMNQEVTPSLVYRRGEWKEITFQVGKLGQRFLYDFLTDTLGFLVVHLLEEQKILRTCS